MYYLGLATENHMVLKKLYGSENTMYYLGSATPLICASLKGPTSDKVCRALEGKLGTRNLNHRLFVPRSEAPMTVRFCLNPPNLT